MRIPVLRFDSFGTVAYVISDVEINVPAIFPEDSENLVETVSRLVNIYSEQYGWQVVALSLSKGLARIEIEDIIENEIRHSGPIIIDPTISTPENQEFNHCGEVKSCKERLVQANESTGDILIILYGIEQVDRLLAVDLLMRRLRLLQARFDMNAESDLEKFFLQQKKERCLADWKRVVIFLREVMGIIVDGGIDQETTNEFDQLGNKINGLLFLTYASIFRLVEDDDLPPELVPELRAMLASVGVMSDQFRSLGIDFDIYYRSARNLRERETYEALPPQPSQHNEVAAVSPENKPETPSPEPV